MSGGRTGLIELDRLRTGRLLGVGRAAAVLPRPAARVRRPIACSNALRARAIDAPAMARLERAALSEDAPGMGAAILPFSQFLPPKPGAL